MSNLPLKNTLRIFFSITFSFIAAMIFNGCLATGDCGPLQTKKENADSAFNAELLTPKESETLVPLRGRCFEMGKDYILTGQLPQPDFQFAKDNGVKTIINVRMDRELGGLGFEMEPHMKGLKLAFVHFPVGPDSFDAAQAEAFVKLLSESEKPLLINGSNGNRIWGLWSLYLGARWGIPVDRTKEVAKANGIKKLVIEEFVRGYLEQKKKG